MIIKKSYVSLTLFSQISFFHNLDFITLYEWLKYYEQETFFHECLLATGTITDSKNASELRLLFYSCISNVTEWYTSSNG